MQILPICKLSLLHERWRFSTHLARPALRGEGEEEEEGGGGGGEHLIKDLKRMSFSGGKLPSWSIGEGALEIVVPKCRPPSWGVVEGRPPSIPLGRWRQLHQVHQLAARDLRPSPFLINSGIGMQKIHAHHHFPAPLPGPAGPRLSSFVTSHDL